MPRRQRPTRNARKSWLEARISSNREAEVAAATAVSARADFAAAEQRVRALGGAADGTPGILRLATPISGKVIERHVSRGQSVEATYTAFRVADLSSRLGAAGGVRTAAHRHPSGRRRRHLPRRVTAIAKCRATCRTWATSSISKRVPRPCAWRSITPWYRYAPGNRCSPRFTRRRPSRPPSSCRAASVTSVDGKPTVFVAHDALSVEPRAVAPRRAGRRPGRGLFRSHRRRQGGHLGCVRAEVRDLPLMLRTPPRRADDRRRGTSSLADLATVVPAQVWVGTGKAKARRAPRRPR